NTYAKLVNGVGAVSFSSDGTRVMSGDADGRVKVWDLFSGRQLLDLKAERLVYTVALNAGGNFLVAIGSGGWAPVWNATSRESLQKFDFRREGGYPDLSADGRRLAICAGGRLRMWDTQSGKEIVPTNAFPTGFA